MNIEYRIFAKCPTTGKEVFTGANHNKSTFAQGEKPFGLFNCTACGNVHTWTHQDASIKETYV